MDYTKKKVRGVRLTREQSQININEVRKDLIDHIGCTALFFQKEGRDMLPYLVEIISVCGKTGVTATHKCYHAEGGFSCNIAHTVDAIKLLTGEQRIIYFDEGI